MQVELYNFRCWKKHTIDFNDKGIILINGTSGSGKSSILNAIYFAITGIGSKIVSYGEKKCSVKLSLTNNDGIKEITRTKSPCRLTVKMSNDETYEDEEAQKIINNHYGNYFQQTSYMTQKLIHSFLNLTPTEKMNFLQKFVFDDIETQNTMIMKNKCKDKISELKKSLIEHKSKISLYENELSLLDNKFNILKNKYSITNYQIIGDYFKTLPLVTYDPNTLKELRDKQSVFNEIFQKYKEYKMKQDEYNNQKQQIMSDIQDNINSKQKIKEEIDNTEYKGDKYIEYLNKGKLYYSMNKKYETLVKNMDNNIHNIFIVINKQNELYKTQIKSAIDNKNKAYEQLSTVYADIDYIKENIEKWNKSTQTIIEYSNLIKEMSKKYDIEDCNNIDTINTNIIVCNNELDEYRKLMIEKQEQLNKMKNDWNMINKIHKCPKCHVYVRIQTSNKDPNKHKLVEDNSDIKELNTDTYNKNTETLQNEISTLSIKINDKQKEIYTKETNKNELIDFNAKYDNYKKRIKRADPLLIKYYNFSFTNNYMSTDNYNNKINNINKWLNDYNKYENEIIHYETLIKSVLGQPEHCITEILDNLKSKNTSDIHINIKQYMNISNNDTINKMLKETLDILEQINYIRSPNDKINIDKLDEIPSLTEDEINNEYLEQTNKKLKCEHNYTLILQIESKCCLLNEKLNNINNKLTSVNNYINNETENIEERCNEINKQINECYEKEQNYNKYMIMNDIYEQWKRLKYETRIHQYTQDNVSNDIVIHEMFLNKINESESITLTKCIDSVNYYINDYLEKFFPNETMIVDIVPFKEKLCKNKTENEMKPGIDIKVCYKGEEVELSALSGGEYDRVSLAIMLSFNHLSTSNMILLDESVASLDAELTNDILEKLKENLNNKRVIVVAHQLSTGLFDQIINTK
uniref:Rad50/SbcC-type AAA domain-containing protein n=1 Tax=viral metagenome TaxID=1070528 RepID=A0A6C0I5B7_9ZZZZ